MRILHILDHSVPLHSGYTFRTLEILKQQRALGWHTMHLTSAKQGIDNRTLSPDERPIAASEHIDGWHFFRTDASKRWWAKFPALRQYGVIDGLTTRLYQLAKMSSPDILHAHSPALNAIAALRVGRALSIPVVYEIRAFWEDAASDHGSSREGGLRYRLTRALESYALHRVDAVTTICEGLRTDISARGIPADKITVIPNAVDINNFSMEPPPDQELAHTLVHTLRLAGHPVAGFIGSFYAYEGLALLLQALPQILESLPSLRLLLVGGGPQEDELKAMAVRLGIDQHVIFAGWVPHQQIAHYYNAIDVLVYPRLSMRLTNLVTPLKPLEAMAQGRLLVASDVGGHKELIEHGKTGILFTAGNAKALAGSLVDLFRHNEQWPALRMAAREYVETERNWRASVGRYANIYTSLLSAKQP
jgi:glycogen(starch) synthase